MDNTHNVYKDGDRYYVREIRECLVDFIYIAQIHNAIISSV